MNGPAQVAASPLSPRTKPTGGSRQKLRSVKGCMTCRRRKVKCPENTPVCGNCERLQLECRYATPKPRASRVRRTSTSALARAQEDVAVETLSGLSPADNDVLNVASQGFGGLPATPYSHQQESNHSPRALSYESWSEWSTHGLDSWDFDLLLGDTAPDGDNVAFDPSLIFQPSMPIDWTQTLSAAQLPDLTQDDRPTQTPSRSMDSVDPVAKARLQSTTGETTTPSAHLPRDEARLLRYFLDSAVPPILVGVESRWNSARDSLLRMAKQSSAVRHAICAFSALSLTQAVECSHHCELAINDLNEAIDRSAALAHNSTPVLEQILATLFFLSYASSMLSSSAMNQPADFLRQAHGILDDRQGRSWTPLGRQLQVWLKLLDAKVVSAGGEGLNVFNSLESSESEETRDRSGISFPGDISPAPEASDQQAEDLIYEALNRPAYRFFLQVLTFSGRIANIDRWHRPRGTVQDEYQVMTKAYEIDSDLNMLWARRPAIVDFAENNGTLCKHLSPRLGQKLEQHLRTYVANYWACYVHLQRVAWATLPATPKTLQSIERIVHLARLSSQGGHSLPAMMLWPLMMAGCEHEDASTRDWIITQMENLNAKVGNASRTAQLVREIIKRQAGGQRADARTVMHQVFGTAFAIV